jgi:hypothetical protein
MDDSVCDGGVGCLLRNINVIGNGWPFMTLFLTTYIILTYSMVQKGNNFLKSFTSATYVMLLIAVVSFPFNVLPHTIVVIIHFFSRL